MDNHFEAEQENPQLSCDRLFRTAVLGFNREDVTSYLARIARERRKESERFTTALRALEGGSVSASAGDTPEKSVCESENAALRSENTLLKLRIENLEKSLEEARQNADAALKEAAKASSESSKAPVEPVPASDTVSSAELAEKDALIASLKSSLEDSELTRRLLEDKLRAFELDKTRASTVVEDARDKAHQMEAEAADQAVQLVRDAQLRIKKLDAQLSALEESVDTASHEYFDRLFANRERFDDLKASTNELRKMIAAFRV